MTEEEDKKNVRFAESTNFESSSQMKNEKIRRRKKRTQSSIPRLAADTAAEISKMLRDDEKEEEEEEERIKELERKQRPRSRSAPDIYLYNNYINLTNSSNGYIMSSEDLELDLLLFPSSKKLEAFNLPSDYEKRAIEILEKYNNPNPDPSPTTTTTTITINNDDNNDDDDETLKPTITSPVKNDNDTIQQLMAQFHLLSPSARQELMTAMMVGEQEQQQQIIPPSLKTPTTPSSSPSHKDEDLFGTPMIVISDEGNSNQDNLDNDISIQIENDEKEITSSLDIPFKGPVTRRTRSTSVMERSPQGDNKRRPRSSNKNANDASGGNRGRGKKQRVLERPRIKDEEKLSSALLELTNETSFTDWVSVRLDQNGVCRLNGSGCDGIDGFIPLLKSDIIIFVFYHVVLDVGYVLTPRTCLITFVGSDIDMMTKSTVSHHKSTLKTFSNAYLSITAELPATKVENVTDDIIQQRMQSAIDLAKKQKERKAAVGNNSRGKKKGTKTQGVSILDYPRLKTALDNLSDDTTDTDWVILGYVEGAIVDVLEIGSEGMDRLRAKLEVFNDKILYVLFRQHLAKEKHSKQVFLTFVPSTVTIREKARVNPHKIALREILKDNGTAISSEIFASDPSSLINNSIAPSRRTAKKSRTSDWSFEDTESSQTLLKEMGNIDSDVHWVLLCYVNDDSTALKVLDSGTGTVEVWRDKNYLKENAVVFGLQRLTIELTEGVNASAHLSLKGMMVSWVGEFVTPFRKALATAHSLSLYKYLRELVTLNGHLQPRHPEELTHELLMAKVMGRMIEKDQETLKVQKSQYTTVQEVKEQQYRLDVERTTRGRSASSIGGSSDMLYDNIRRASSAMGFEGKDRVSSALDELMDENNNEVEWIKLGYADKTFRHVIVMETGIRCMSDTWRNEQLDDTKCFIFIFVVVTPELGYGLAYKNIYVNWIGEKVIHKQKALANELHCSILNHVENKITLHATLSCNKPSDLTISVILERISGSRIRSESTLTGKSTITSDRFKKYGGTGSNKKDGSGGTSMIIENKDDIQNAISMLTDENNPMSWLIVTYKEESANIMILKHTGIGDLNEYKEYLLSNNSAFIVYRILWSPPSGAPGITLPERSYYGLIHWQGIETGIMETALSSFHFEKFVKFIKDIFISKACVTSGTSYFCDNLDDLNHDALKLTMNLKD